MSIAGTDILARIRNVIGEGKFALHEPWMCGNEKKYVSQTIDDNWVSSAGPFVTKFENDLAAFCGVKHAVAVTNGTVALHAAYMACGVTPDSEVIIPSITFVATANAVSHAGAHVHLVDCDARTLAMDADKLEAHLQECAEMRDGKTYNRQTGRIIAALCPVHIFGIPANLDALDVLAKRWNLVLVQDAAEALGTTINDKSVFHWGACAVTSFNGNKIITSGGGGAILTNDDALAQKLKHLTTTAKQPHAYEFYHDMVGYNYRMPNINAALATAQLENMPKFLKNKQKLADAYAQSFQGCTHADFLQTNHCVNHWLNAIVLRDGAQRNDVLEFLNKNGIQARPLWTPMHQLPMYENAFASDLSTSNDVSMRVINIPSSAILGEHL